MESKRQNPRFPDSVKTMKIIELDEVESTNEYCKRLEIDDDVIVIAKRQTAGRGTKGRTFVSEIGGVYLSAMRFYKEFSPCSAFKIMVNSCVAVCKTVEAFSVRPNIRWANDVLVGGKKISGILIENSFKSDCMHSVVGIGLNINNPIPHELKDIATNLSLCAQRIITAEEAALKLIENLGKEYTVSDYKSYINFFGEKITLITADGQRIVTALDVTDEGLLKVAEASGKVSLISAAEVSLRN